MRKIFFFQTYACSFECLALSLEYANFKGKCYLLNWDGKFFGIIGMRGIKKLSPLAMPIITVAGTMFSPSVKFVEAFMQRIDCDIQKKSKIEALPESPLEDLRLEIHNHIASFFQWSNFWFLQFCFSLNTVTEEPEHVESPCLISFLP
ncbi:hypothetical protein AVEN_187300-1 [Araneus ventricosus]|uniref:Uncharacterized protein n=1 Tax=Araneus ventricosus TaxID=182803 RepID=A0A4Y2UVF3_ARAVE|nr:hypothetical protein AVEN_251264-1 [Araneus ventricosus]GBO16801.1 hypothetical protein AVEN_259083-1 [Araneus ventricosus]GBO16802.1 hypothetical protein AVEN_24421-1 [Araneus ventricosus]GBO16803.1 hypothetical protein AVEN_187300-1 [Araneus ventricosus]